MRIHTLEHVPFETPGHILTWAAARGHALQRTRLFAGDPLPVPGTFDWLVVMGGPMSVHDEPQFAWLAPEKACLRAAVASGGVVLGICLGAQLLAEVLGGRVHPNPTREIGWFPIRHTPDIAHAAALARLPDGAEVLHWHGETFALPPGAVHACRSAACAHQAFVHGGRCYGLQFHLEVTPDGCRELIAHGAHELAPAPHVQAAHAMLTNPQRFTTAHCLLEQVLDAIG